MAFGPADDSTVRARCEGAVIRQVDVQCLDIFDPVPVGRFSGIYSGMNKLHIRTRSSTVRSLVLVEPGQVWNSDRILETERLLRQVEYLEPAVIRSRLVNDSVDVQVVTHDQWTTQPELNLERGGGVTYGSVGFSERNLLGMGLGLSLAYRNEPTGHTRSAELSSRRLFGSQLEGQLKAASGTTGTSDAVALGEPFRSLDDPRSWSASWWRTNAEQLLFSSGSVVASFPFRFEQAMAERGFGHVFPDGQVRRYTLGMALYDRNYGPTVASPNVPVTFPGGEEELKMRWAFGRATFWTPHWIERRGIEMFDQVEDFDVGALVSLEGGMVMRMLGSTADEAIAKLRFETGTETRRFGFGYAHALMSTRIRGGPLETLAHIDSRWIQQPSQSVTLVVAALGESADRAPREVQYIIGGLNGLRAYPVQALAGTQVWRLNGETRWVAARDVLSLVSLGGAAFVDAARAWGPGSNGEPWHHDAGFGLRLSFPHAAMHQVARFDVAFPLSPTRDGRREAVFSFGSSQAF
jgi:hypothetical protein